MIRLKDIAARAGVSVMTVSKVLRDAPDISTLTKTRIRSLAHEMGYMPDSVVSWFADPKQSPFWTGNFESNESRLSADCHGSRGTDYGSRFRLYS